MGEIGRLTYIRRLGIPKRIGISQLRFRNISWDDLATYIMRKFGENWSSNLEISMVVAYTPSSISSAVSTATFAWRRHWLSVVSFMGRWSRVFSFVSPIR